eukprot:jgi/Picsp_1/1830/NSC_05297-R1_protein
MWRLNWSEALSLLRSNNITMTVWNVVRIGHDSAVLGSPSMFNRISMRYNSMSMNGCFGSVSRGCSQMGGRVLHTKQRTYIGASRAWRKGMLGRDRVDISAGSSADIGEGREGLPSSSYASTSEGGLTRRGPLVGQEVAKAGEQFGGRGRDQGRGMDSQIGSGYSNHHEYHKLSKQWSVPRTSLSHYPEDARNAIVRNQRPLEGMTKSQAGALLDKLHDAIEFERDHGFRDFRGRSGERFSSWIRGQLGVLIRDCDALLTSADEQMLQQVQGLFISYDKEFEVAKKVDILQECERLLGQVGSRIHSHSARKGNGAETTEETIQHDDSVSMAPRESTKVFDTATYITERNEEWKKSKPSTSEFRQGFIQTALSAAQQVQAQGGVNDMQGDQRTEIWRSLRERRLTASSFSKALGFFSGDRVSLWEEKIGVREPFKGNDATRWGTRNEARALATYETLTGEKVESCMFKVKKDDIVHDWLGASPDGLIAGLGIADNHSQGSSLAGPGVLEIKCPYNKGHPELADPPKNAIWYYMPQIQGLMDVFDRDWCNLYIWTPNRGSASFLVARDREYWSACFDILAEFWWAHTVPARQKREINAGSDDWMQYKPSEVHTNSKLLRDWSKRLAWNAPGRFFRHIDDSKLDI